MGDRGNICVVDEDGGKVFLYTHWQGSQIRGVVRAALAKQWRWNDPPYLTRIIFDMLTEDAHGEETGFGISTGICDNSHPIVFVDCGRQRVFLGKPSDNYDPTRADNYDPTRDLGVTFDDWAAGKFPPEDD